MKLDQYAELVTARKTCRACPDLVNPSVAHDGTFDSNRIGPYTQWQGNLDAQIVVVLQDFADVETFERVKGWPGPKVRTNLTLVELLTAAGIHIKPPELDVSNDQVFFTNAVLCLKRGSMQSPISPESFKECGRRFLRRTIELVTPRVVAALGVGALNATLSAFGLPRSESLVSLIENRVMFDLPCGARLFPLCHPSPTVLNVTRSLEKQKADWRRIGDYLGQNHARV